MAYGTVRLSFSRHVAGLCPSSKTFMAYGVADKNRLLRLLWVVLDVVALELDELIEAVSTECLTFTGVLESCPRQILGQNISKLFVEPEKINLLDLDSRSG
jgi:hypothetical protein